MEKIIKYLISFLTAIAANTKDAIANGIAAIVTPKPQSSRSAINIR